MLSIAIYATATTIGTALLVAGARIGTPAEASTQRFIAITSEVCGAHVLLLMAALAGAAISWLWGV